MKKILLSLLTIATISITSFGQAPEGFKYQAVIRDAGNVILNNQSVGMQIEILQGGIAGTPVYTESFAPTSNNYGLVNLEIGTGSTSDDFTSINWESDTYFIRTSIDVTGGSSYIVMGTSQLMSVPYALHAKTAETALIDNVNDADSDPTNELQDWSTLPNIPVDFLDNIDNVDDADNDPTNELQDWTTLPGIPVDFSDNIDNVDDADNDPTNELQAVSFSNDTLYLSNGGQVYLGDYGVDFVEDADADPANEIQTISRAGTTVTLSNGGGTFEDSVGVYTAGEGVDITNNIVSAPHNAVQTNNPFNFQWVPFSSPPQNLDLGFPSLVESGYIFSPTSVTVLNSGKYLLNYDATLEQDPCGNPTVELSIAINGTTVISSVVSGVVGAGGCFESTSFARSLFLILNAGDIISVQIENTIGCCDDARVKSNNFSIVKM